MNMINHVGLLLVSTLPTASAHSRWSCPEPRSPSTGIKRGPCGNDYNNFDTPLQATTDDGGDESIVEITPGPLRITFEESLHHTGAPFRISLSNDGNDDESCVLLDHIPHNDCCSPSIPDPTTYTPYAITINIPNVICERCSLHLSNPMTDKIGGDGAPTAIGCTDPDGSCFSVYHSCTKPFRIVGDTSESGGGAVPRSEYQCPNYQDVNENWPKVWTGDNGGNVDASTPGVYRRESSVWSTDDHTLTTAPLSYREDTGGLCGEKTESSASNTNKPSNFPTASLKIETTLAPQTSGLLVPASSSASNDPSFQTGSPTSQANVVAETNTPSVPANTSPSIENEIDPSGTIASGASIGGRHLIATCSGVLSALLSLFT